MRPTLEDVARAAAVSRATVSRVVNNQPGVAPPVREWVRGIIAETGYQPHLGARALVSGQADVVDLVIVDDDPRALSANPHYSRVISGGGGSAGAQRGPAAREAGDARRDGAAADRRHPSTRDAAGQRPRRPGGAVAARRPGGVDGAVGPARAVLRAGQRGRGADGGAAPARQRPPEDRGRARPGGQPVRGGPADRVPGGDGGGRAGAGVAGGRLHPSDGAAGGP